LGPQHDRDRDDHRRDERQRPMPDIRHMLNHNWDTQQSSRLEIANSD
jgi:hypothetical protein